MMLAFHQLTLSDREAMQAVTLPSGFLSPDNGGTEGGVKTIEFGGGLYICFTSQFCVPIFSMSSTAPWLQYRSSSSSFR